MLAGKLVVVGLWRWCGVVWVLLVVGLWCGVVVVAWLVSRGGGLPPPAAFKGLFLLLS